MQKKYTVISVLCIYFFLFYSTGEWKKKLSKTVISKQQSVFLSKTQNILHTFLLFFYNFVAKLSFRNHTKTNQN